jgi:hypothetical protein
MKQERLVVAANLPMIVLRMQTAWTTGFCLRRPYRTNRIYL